MTEAGVDQAILRAESYRDSSRLRARADIYHWLEQPADLHGSVLEQLPSDVEGPVLDVGCGPGSYLARLRDDRPTVVSFGLDLSDGMAAEASQYRPALAGDVQALPFPAARFSAVLAPHMLYHLRDVTAGVDELARVLRPGGLLVAVTNGEQHLSELRRLFNAAVSSLTGSPFSVTVSDQRFSLENGAAVLARRFHVDGPVRLPNRLRVPESGPVRRYLDSTRSLWSRQLPAEVEWDDVLDAAEGLVASEIEREGVWTCRTEPGLFVCRRLPGDRDG
jgi:SAM-dependent methyltransferase